MKIGIAGIGVVGDAVYQSFKQKLNSDYVFPYDKYKSIGNFHNLLDCDIVFLCLPTPYSDQLQSYDKSAIFEVCANLNEKKYSGLVVIKSTVEPETTNELSIKYTLLKIIHNPEFLSAQTAYEDFQNQTHIVLGKGPNCQDEDIEKLSNFYRQLFPNVDISIANSTETELMKIAVNNFYSVKIQFFNEIYSACEKNGSKYETVLEMMLKNGWISPHHVRIPGPDGKRSYGGMCFPKDTNAFLQYLKKYDLPHQVLEATIKERNWMREDK